MHVIYLHTYAHAYLYLDVLPKLCLLHFDRHALCQHATEKYSDSEYIISHRGQFISTLFPTHINTNKSVHKQKQSDIHIHININMLKTRQAKCLVWVA